MMIRSFLLLFCFLSLTACVGQRLAPAPPPETYALATVPGFPEARFWGDEAPPDADRNITEVIEQTSARARLEGRLPNNGRIDLLVLSGGGSDGAWGAGLLNGWTERGDRPEFALVTGISTGALIAPFAFVGAETDPELERFYTQIRTSDVAVLGLYDALVGNSLGLVNTAGFTRTVDRAVTPQLVRRIAEEHNKGRRLWVGTSNLDAQRPVIWNISRIAATGKPGARELIRDVLIASASIPGAFTPQLIDVEVDGQRYTEMHVDGGVTRQLFLYPIDFRLRQHRSEMGRVIQPGTIYVVRNTQLDPKYERTKARVVEIAARSISTLIKFSGVADVEIVKRQALDDGFGLKLTAVPPTFDVPENEPFDPDYMRALYELGYTAMVDGDPWETVYPTPR